MADDGGGGGSSSKTIATDGRLARVATPWAAPPIRVIAPLATSITLVVEVSTPTTMPAPSAVQP